MAAEPIVELGYDPMEAFAAVAGDVRNPYPELADRREKAPIELGHFMPDIPTDPDDPDTYTVYSCELVSQVLRDSHHFSSEVYGEVIGIVMGHSILEMDEPEHRVHRALVSQAFRQKTLARWENELVGAVCDELIDRFAGRGKADLVREYTFPFPVQVIARILGLPKADWPKFQKWSIELISVGFHWDRGMAASRSLRDYFKTIVDQRRVDPQDDLISDLCCAEIEGHQLTDDEIFAFLRLLLPAGAETTYRSSSNLLFLLLTHPDQLQAVIEDRALMPQAIEEALRVEPPLLFIMRTAATDVELGGTLVPKGSFLSVCLGSANHDPASTRTPTASTSSATPASTSPSGSAPTCAWACTLPAWRPGWPSTACSTASRTSASTRPPTTPTSTASCSARRRSSPSSSGDRRRRTLGG